MEKINNLGTFAIVEKQTQIQHIPENWIIMKGSRECVVWPNSQVSEKIHDQNSMPVLVGPDKWIECGNYQVVKRGISTEEEANKLVEWLEEHSDLENCPLNTERAKRIEKRCESVRYQKSIQIGNFNVNENLTAPPSTKAFLVKQKSVELGSNESKCTDVDNKNSNGVIAINKNKPSYQIQPTDDSYTTTTYDLPIIHQANYVDSFLAEASPIAQTKLMFETDGKYYLMNAKPEANSQESLTVETFTIPSETFDDIQMNISGNEQLHTSSIAERHENISSEMFQQILTNQSNILMQIIDIRKTIKNIERDVAGLKNGQLTLMTKSSSTSWTVVSELPSAPFELIRTEKEFNEFEEKLNNDVSFKNQCLTYLLSAVGNLKKTGKTPIDAAFLFERKIFANSFWTLTAWTGGRSTKRRRNDDKPNPENPSNAPEINAEEVVKLKFEFSKHQVFRNFFTQLVFNALDFVMSEDEMKKFVQSRSKNAFYDQKTDRMPTSRSKKSEPY